MIKFRVILSSFAEVISETIENNGHQRTIERLLFFDDLIFWLTENTIIHILAKFIQFEQNMRVVINKKEEKIENKRKGQHTVTWEVMEVNIL